MNIHIGDVVELVNYKGRSSPSYPYGIVKTIWEFPSDVKYGVALIFWEGNGLIWPLAHLKILSQEKEFQFWMDKNS